MADLSDFPITKKWPPEHPVNRRLDGRHWIMGDFYTIADMAIFPWVNTLIGFYDAGDLVRIADFPHVTRALNAFLARPAVVRGLDIPKRT